MADELLERYRAELKRLNLEPIQRLGRGSSGVVFKAIQKSVDRPVAVKIYTAISGANAEMEKRFRREARILARMDHPNIPFVLTAGDLSDQQGKTPFHLMQFVDGENLTSVLARRKRLTWAEAAPVCEALLSALIHASDAGIVHRDVAPDNILISKSNRVFLVDFSLGMSVVAPPGLTRATESGRQLGRAAYASPEQRRDAGKATAKSDVFSAGVVLFEMLSGTPELRVADLNEVLPNVPQHVRLAIRKACSEDAERRWTAADFLAALRTNVPAGVRAEVAPSLAACPNFGCAKSIRTVRGYTFAPKVLGETRDLFCGDCASKLVRACPGCHAPLPEDLSDRFRRTKGDPLARVFCTQCSTLIMEVPSCKKCGSLLQNDDFKRDTVAGCAKCLAAPKPQSEPQATPADDEIPF